MVTPGYDGGGYKFGAIGEEVKAARLDDIYDLNFDGGVLLENPSASSQGSEGSLRELVQNSEPLIKESPRAGSLLAANKTQLCFPDSPPAGSAHVSYKVWSAPEHSSPYPRQNNSDVDSSPTSRQACSEIESLPTSRQARSEIDHSPTPCQTYTHISDLNAATPHRHLVRLSDLKRSSPNPQALQTNYDDTVQQLSPLTPTSPVDYEQRVRSDTVLDSATSSNKRFEQKTYKELFNSVNSKIELTVRKLVSFQVGYETRAFIDFTAYHVNFDKVNIKIANTTIVQPAFVHGMIWRMAHDLIFIAPVLDHAPSTHAGAYREAWLKDVGCCTTNDNSHDWTNVKGPLMKARVAAARQVIDTTPSFNHWIKQFAASITTEIVDRLDPVWRHGTKAQACYELRDPITKLVRIAIRMRAELRHFDFHFFEYGTKARSDLFIHYNVDPSLPPPPASDDDDQHVVLTKEPQISEKDYEQVRKVVIYQAEVVVSKNFENNAHLSESHRGRKVRGYVPRNVPRTPRRQLRYQA